MDPRVLKAMLPCFTDHFGNAASKSHAYGRKAEELVEKARRQVADLIGAQADEIVFTSGTTESDNLAIKGVCRLYRDKGDHVVTSVLEHRAVLDTCKALEKEGFRVTYLPVDKDGLLALEDLEHAITPKTILISLMAANNEIGVLNPVEQIGAIAHERGVFFHCDAAQAAGKIPLNVQTMNIDLMAFSAHKMYGPKGVGVLYVRRKNPRVRLEPMMEGGGHEHGMRSGTLNVPAIVGFGEACAIAKKEMAAETKRVGALRDSLRDKIVKAVDEVSVNGHATQRLAGNLNMSFAYLEAEALLQAVQSEMAVSTGSACASSAPEPSHVLKALGVPERLASCALRFGLGRFNTQEEVDFVADQIVQKVKALRKVSPLVAMSKEKTGS